MDLWNDSQLYRLGFDGMGRVWCGVVMQVFFGDNSFSHYKIRTHDVGKLRFSRVYGLYRMGSYDVVRGCHPAGELTIKCCSDPQKNPGEYPSPFYRGNS